MLCPNIWSLPMFSSPADVAVDATLKQASYLSPISPVPQMMRRAEVSDFYTYHKVEKSKISPHLSSGNIFNFSTYLPFNVYVPYIRHVATWGEEHL